jgi:hypothetical protein
VLFEGAVFSNESIFTYLGTTWDKVNAEADTFVPTLGWDVTPINGTAEDLANACGASGTEFYQQCAYDFNTMGSSSLAKETQSSLQRSADMTRQLNKQVQHCTALDLPYLVRSTTDGTHVGSVATVTGCVKGYEPVIASKPFPFNLTCEIVTNPVTNKSQVTWTPVVDANSACTQSVMYSTQSANNLNDPYRVVGAEELGMTDFAITYLGRRITKIKVNRYLQ